MSEVHVGEWSGVENRKHRRVPLRVPIECRQGAARLEAVAENISVSGLLVRCKEAFPQDSEISVSFTLPGSPTPIRTQARVAHVVPEMFMGLELLNLPEESRYEIGLFLAAALPVAKPK